MGVRVSAPGWCPKGGPFGGLHRAESVLVHLAGGRDGCVQVAQGKLQEHDGRGRTEQVRYCQSVYTYFEVRCQLTIIVTSSSSSNSSK